MDNTANEKHLPNVEASQCTEPLVAGRFRAWRRGGSLAVGEIAKFSPKEKEPSNRWLEGTRFRVAYKNAFFTLVVVRYKKEEFHDQRSVLVSGGRNEKRWSTTPAYTMPELVVCRVVAVESRG